MKLFLSFLLLSICLNVSAQNRSCDTLSEKKFHKLLRKIRMTILNQFNLSISQIITLVKLYNTVHLAEFGGDDDADEYIKLFDENIRYQVLDSLKTIASVGMNHYSPKYDLYVGVGRNMNCNHFYTVRFKKDKGFAPGRKLRSVNNSN
jgi:hypothetical protein